ncbi:MAG: hypothetical protein PHG97_00800 [Candidatus Margulisbacteria bacterium]|nr:hypothetical protein [Candidatus Margulisiibacteriota bacterium]
MIRSLLKKLEIERAVIFLVLSKVWALFAIPATALLIVSRFTPVLQGYYYTFLNILSLQVLVELGLGYIIVQFASHEWSRLGLARDGSITGDKNSLSRLASLAGFASKWYLIAGAVAAAGLGLVGFIFFSASANQGIDWTAPWLLLSFLTGVTIFLIFIWSLLEGSNQVANLYAFRLFQTAASNVALWTAILFGAGLWSVSISSLTAQACAFLFLRFKYWSYIKTLLFTATAGPRINWKKEVLPMQWRFALSGISGYCIFFLFTPVLFYFHGPVVAGQFGMTWSIVAAVGSISYAWIIPRIPSFGILIAKKEYGELDRLFKKLLKIMIGLVMLESIGLWLLVLVLNWLDFPLVHRLLPPWPTGILILAQIVMVISLPFSAYLRAHKKEPLFFLSMLQGFLIGASTFILGRYFSALGMVAGYLAVNLLITPSIIYVWHQLRKKWHADDYIDAALLTGETI